MPMMAMTTNNSTSVNAWRAPTLGSGKPCAVLPSSYGIDPSLRTCPSRRGQVRSPPPSGRTVDVGGPSVGLSGLGMLHVANGMPDANERGPTVQCRVEFADGR